MPQSTPQSQEAAMERITQLYRDLGPDDFKLFQQIVETATVRIACISEEKSYGIALAAIDAGLLKKETDSKDRQDKWAPATSSKYLPPSLMIKDLILGARTEAGDLIFALD